MSPEFLIILFCFIIPWLIIFFLNTISYFTSPRITIRYNTHNRNNIVEFLDKYKLQYKEYNGGFSLKYNLSYVIKRIFLYSRIKNNLYINNKTHTYENEYMCAEYKQACIILTDKISKKILMITRVENQLWDEILRLGYKNIDRNKFWLKLMKTGLINKHNSQEFDDYVTKKEKRKEKQNIKKLKKEQRRYNKRKVLDINNCSPESFNKLPGINIAIAKRLIRYRASNSFKSVEQFWNTVNVKSHIKELIEAKYIIKVKNKRKFSSKTINNFYILRTIERIVDII